MINRICRFFKKNNSQFANKGETISTKDTGGYIKSIDSEIIEFSLKHFPYPLVNFHSDTLDYFLSEEQLDELYDENTDFKNYSDFQKWIPIIFGLGDLNPHDFTDSTHPYTQACKNCLKYLIASNSFIEHDIYISGIDGMYDLHGEQFFWNEYHIFLIRVYQYLFKEEFVYEDVSKFRERIDKEFVENPSSPELWGNPIYKQKTI